MGYRHYLYKIKKETTKALQNKTMEELWEEFTPQKEKDFQNSLEDKDKCLNIFDIPQEDVFEFGKLYWDDTAERIYNTGKPLFENEEIQKQFDDYCPYIVTREALKIAIEIYKEKIINYYKNLFVENDKLCDPFFHIPIEEIKQSIQEKCVEHCREMMSEWTRGFAINEKQDSEKLTNSWKYEYEIFELLRLYKTFDFEKYDLLFYGW